MKLFKRVEPGERLSAVVNYSWQARRLIVVLPLSRWTSRTGYDPWLRLDNVPMRVRRCLRLCLRWSPVAGLLGFADVCEFKDYESGDAGQ